MNHIKHIVIVAMLSLLAACGGSGGSGGGGTPSAVTTVSGIAAMGTFDKKGSVAVYPVSDAGVKGITPLALGTIGDNSAYSVNIGSYSGPIVVEVSGTYRDEATGTQMTVPASAPLHAALDFVTAGKSFSLPVTPLTELAYRRAGPLTATNIRDANDMISYIMRLDIINTPPVATTADAFKTATQSQINYALILAGFSQIMATQGTSLDVALTNLDNGLATTATATALNDALATYMTNHPELAGTTVPATLQNIGTIGKKLTLKMSGDVANIDRVHALAVTLTLPDGLLLRTDSEGIPLPEVFKLSGGDATAQNMFTARYVAASGNPPATKATIALSVLAPKGGLKAGDVLTIIFNVGSTAPEAKDVGLSDFKFWDQNGAELPTSGQPVLSLL